MALPPSVRRWLHLPGSAAFMLGLGALSGAGARTDTPDQVNGTPFDEQVIRSEDGKIYLSEGGRETELQLSATRERDRLLRLLQDQGSAGIKLDRDPRLIMSGGGGTGFSLRDIKNSIIGEPAPAQESAPQTPPPPRSPKPGSAPRDNNQATDRKG